MMGFPLLACGDNSVLTYSGAVKRWECDRNDHMNVQFYVRAFQMASEILAASTTGTNPGAASASLRHYRFHKELFTSDTMRIRSSRIADGIYAGAVVHWMETGPEGRLSATAIEIPNYPVDKLPGRSESDIKKAIPRGLTAEPHVWNANAFAGEARLPVISVGVVRPADVDHTGDIQANILTSFISAASHDLLNRIGMTAAWIDETNRNRMAVEMKVTRLGPCRAGQFLDVVSGITEAGRRQFVTRHQVVNAITREPCATMEQVMLVVDLKARRPVEVPDFIHQAYEHYRFEASR